MDARILFFSQTARTLGSPPGEAAGQAAKRPPRAGRLEEDAAEVARRLCRNPGARRGRSERQTTTGTDSPDSILNYSTPPMCRVRFRPRRSELAAYAIARL